MGDRLGPEAFTPCREAFTAMIGEAHHYGVTVSDMDTALEFYRDVLDLSLSDRFTIGGEAFDRFVGVEGTDVEIAFLDGGGCAVELLEYREPAGGDANAGVSNNDVGAAHFCFEVDDIDEAYEQVADRSDPISDPQTLDSGARVVYVTDPDGNVVEFLEP